MFEKLTRSNQSLNRENRAKRIALVMILCGLFISLHTLPGFSQPSDSAPAETETSEDNNSEQSEATKPQPDTSKTEQEEKAERALQARLKARAEQEQSLREIEKALNLSQERSEELEEEVARLRTDRQTIQSDLIGTAERIKKLEKSLSGQEQRLKILFEDETALRVTLAEQRDSLSEILAALQRIGRNPPPALAIRPNEALSAVRSAMLLSTLVPEIRLEAQSLASQLEELIRLRKQIEQEKLAMQNGLQSLGEERKRLDLLLEKKRQQEEKSREQIADESQKTRDLAQKAKSITELIASMEQEIEAARLAVKEAKDAERAAIEQEIKTKQQKIAALKNAARLSPAIPFSRMKGLLQLPAEGTIVKTFGTKDGLGGQSLGLSLSTRTGAQVTSPADGWIVYSGPFRSFGKLLIINAGDGYHIILAGLEYLTTEVGTFVLANEPIGQMRKESLEKSDLLDANASKPVLYMELRKSGVAINPTPWWTIALNEKADG